MTMQIKNNKLVEADLDNLEEILQTEFRLDFYDPSPKERAKNFIKDFNVSRNSNYVGNDLVSIIHQLTKEKHTDRTQLAKNRISETIASSSPSSSTFFLATSETKPTSTSTKTSITTSNTHTLTVVH